jgi:hypothetical protein
MDISQLVGFIISVIAILFLVRKRVKEEKHRKEHPDQYENEQLKQQEQLKGFLKSLDIDMEDKGQFSPPPRPVVKPPRPAQQTKTLAQAQKKDGKPPKPQRIVADEFKFKSGHEYYEQKTSIEQRKMKSPLEERYKDIYGDRVVSLDLREDPTHTYEVIQQHSISRARGLIQRLPTKKNLVLLHDIFGVPKGLQK